jgi:hypothetical protein
MHRVSYSLLRQALKNLLVGCISQQVKVKVAKIQVVIIINMQMNIGGVGPDSEPVFGIVDEVNPEFGSIIKIHPGKIVGTVHPFTFAGVFTVSY